MRVGSIAGLPWSLVARRRLYCSVAAVIAGHTPARMTVGSIEYLGTYSATNRVALWRGVNANIVVHGSLLDLATSAEIKTASGDAPFAMAVDIGDRVHGPNTQITLRVQSSVNTPTGDYRILIHYAVEVAGPDHVDIHLFDRGVVGDYSIAEPPTNGKYVVGQAYTLVVTGTKMAGAALNTGASGQSAVTLLQTVSRTESEARYKIKFERSGQIDFFTRHIYDGSMSTLPTLAQGATAGYVGRGTPFTFIAGILPSISSVSPASTGIASPVTISGANLAPRGYVAEARFLLAYHTADASQVQVPAFGSGNSLTFNALSNVRPDSAMLVFARSGSTPVDSLVTLTVPLPPVSILNRPIVLRTEQMGATGIPPFPIVREGQQVILGEFLGGSLVVPPGDASSGLLGLRTLRTAQKVTVAAIPTVTFGSTPLSVASLTYSPAAFNGVLTGIDSLVVTMPTIVDTMTAPLTITTPAGAVTLNDVYYVPKPRVPRMLLQVAPGQFRTSLDGKLIRGATYCLLGTGLELRRNGQFVRRATVALNGATIPVFLSATDPGLFFTVPASATSGPLTVTTLGEPSNVGSFLNYTVIDPPAGVTIAGLSLSPSIVAGGQPLTMTLAINGSVTPGTIAGSVVFTASPPDAALALPTGQVSVTSNPLVFNVQTAAVSTVHNIQIRVSNVDQAVSNSSAIANVTIRPPAPTGMTFAGAAVTGGQTAVGTVQMNTTAAPAANLTVALASSDPTTATVPATATINGTTATFTVTTKVVPQSRTVTIFATSDGVTQSAVLTVDPPTVASVALSQSSVVATAQVTATVNLTAAPPTPATVSISCSDPAAICPPSITISGTSATFPISTQAVPAARPVVVTAALNGGAKTSTLTIAPISIQSATLSPTSVRGSATSSLTIQLNGPARVPFSLHIVSGNTDVVPSPADVSFSATDIARFVVLTPTNQARTQAVQVPITLSLTLDTRFGPYTSSVVATLTVQP